MEISQLWFRFVRLYIKIGLFFYTKKVQVIGKENIPKKGAVLFAVNHPNGLIDPLIVTCHNRRTSYFLVKAAAFKNPIAEKILNSLNLVAIYRMRDGINQLAKNEAVFKQCFEILRKEKSLMIFPEGSDDKNRTVRTLSKGFTRIVFGALEKHPGLKIKVIPVGLTYQNITSYPSKVALHYGTPIDANEIYENHILSKSNILLKNLVNEQLKTLCVHIEANENYKPTIATLNNAQVDFTEVDKVKKILEKNKFPSQEKKPINYLVPIYFILVINSFIPYSIWKYASKKNRDKDFTDTLRFSYNIVLFPVFYWIQAFIISIFFGSKTALIYGVISLLLVLMYSKLAPTPTK
jgi:1-acyl-sn-glycerol-3-phosphate acyltransferase